MATTAASPVTIQPTSSARAFAVIRVSAETGRCISITSAPLCRSPESRRMPTNGSRNAALISYAPKVGPHTPTSGAHTAPQPVPAPSLTSENVRTLSTKAKPTSGPVNARSTHQARDAVSSRHSLRSSHANALRERKERSFQIARLWRPAARSRGSDQFVACSGSNHSSRAEQHESIADTGRISDLMNGQEQRPSGGGLLAQQGRHFAALAQIEPLERLGRQQT